jgi:hypothetical protein
MAARSPIVVGPSSTQTHPWRLRSRMAGVLCKPPSLKLSRETEFGASGHCRISTSGVSKIAADRSLSKIRQCANDPERP